MKNTNYIDPDTDGDSLSDWEEVEVYENDSFKD